MGAPASGGGEGAVRRAEGEGTASPQGDKGCVPRSLAKRWHPDVAGAVGAASFLEIQLAYATLSDSEGREMQTARWGAGFGVPGGRSVLVAERWETSSAGRSYGAPRDREVVAPLKGKFTPF
ncbi:hypothetical protein AXF42_Ash010854 [Apostasia shenzhenica]|uniref:J domain-containing protein n=1 Tax=Apostasia shenzhenica TaxID=1088818 RepID=A0A2I0A0V4_9ASPA|nr:hypothetical protein AXF42_Ash010854 [Apostasia shenzhenica]